MQNVTLPLPIQSPLLAAFDKNRIRHGFFTRQGGVSDGLYQGLNVGLGSDDQPERVQENRRRKVTGDVEARICAIACSEPPEGTSRWTMQAIADELIRLEVVDYITDSTVCEVMKKMKSSRGS